MPEVVTVQLEAPNEHSQGVVTEGYYIVNGGVLTMTLPDGCPALVDGLHVQHVLAAGEDPRKIAGRLTPKVRRALMGISEAQEKFGRSQMERGGDSQASGFGRSIRYQNMGLA